MGDNNGNAHDILTNKTRIAMPMASWWHLLLILAALFYWGFEIKGSIDNAAALANRAAEIATEALQQSRENDQQLRALDGDLRVFHKMYDDDMDRYIREPRKGPR